MKKPQAVAFDASKWPWRTGRKLGRTIYAQVGHDPSDKDVLLGLVDSPEVAERIVVLQNLSLIHEHKET